MRTPTVMIIGMVLAPCGLVLNLTSTVAPAWRTLASLLNRPTDITINQGLWDICQVSTTNQNQQCGLADTTYFNQQVVQVARGLMITSLVVNALGIALASWGVRCWEDLPNFLISGFGGLVIFISGVLSLIPNAWYNNLMYTMSSSTADGQQYTYVGYALVLGYLGSCLEIIGGFSLMLCFVPPCKKCIKNRGKPTSRYYSKKQAPYKEKPTSHVFSIQNPDYPSKIGYSVENDNYQHSKKTNSMASSPRSYTNPMDVTAGEHPRRLYHLTFQLLIAVHFETACTRYKHSCKNGRSCMLGHFCACPEHFPGRHREFGLRYRHCGSVVHLYWRPRKCVLCRYVDGALFCFPSGDCGFILGFYEPLSWSHYIL